ncbi:DUF927 domain-containing protein [Lacrimispora defluvii]|uniref:DUF927 domain-containing protein n=1 Tax=Lacrimispora defluvii TaxID=2719233 RepID=A0ABX1VYV1_9FIRM|nr:DUF927 domain-containing protein [Lacrimispora defluvii]NNJ31621.1 DUF927 domain-containing protein [Lacrimispora defluvii]
MVPLNELTAETILSDETLTEVFDEEDEIHRARLLLSLSDRAKELGVKTKFESLVKAFNRVLKETQKARRDKETQQQSYDNYTQFGDDYPAYYCGNWVADIHGVRTYTILGEQLACYHPIIPVQRLKNAETKKEKVKLAFQKGYRWEEIIVDKEIIASAAKIVSLAPLGVSVTSETAKYLVRYLADVENYNLGVIGMQVSTSKLGWFDDNFLPYTENIIFDGEAKYKDIFDAVVEHGDYDLWMQLVKETRRSSRIEPHIYMAGSFASVLIGQLDMLPFILNVWGDTGKGKTVSIMMAASIWANPREGMFMADSTDTATTLEVKCDVLNDLPLLLDDLSKRAKKYGMDEVTDLIYALCAGKGKGRSDTSLSLRRVPTWKNVILTNIERPLSSDTMRGGAVNRVIDVEMEEGDIFPDGNKTVAILKENYGFAGREFVQTVQDIGMDTIKAIQREFYEKILQIADKQGVQKEPKQMLPLSAILTADKIATEYIFMDGIYLDIEKCVGYLKSRDEVSEHARAYEYIQSEVSINMAKFKPEPNVGYKGEIWGAFDQKTGCVCINPNAFARIGKSGNFDTKAFCGWAMKKNLMVIDEKNKKIPKVKKINGASVRCYWIKLPPDQDGPSEFVSVDDEQMELPFN